MLNGKLEVSYWNQERDARILDDIGRDIWQIYTSYSTTIIRKCTCRTHTILHLYIHITFPVLRNCLFNNNTNILTRDEYFNTLERICFVYLWLLCVRVCLVVVSVANNTDLLFLHIYPHPPPPQPEKFSTYWKSSFVTW